MAEKAISIEQWVVGVIKHENNNDKVFRTKAKDENVSQICGILNTHIFNHRKDTFGKAFSR